MEWLKKAGKALLFPHGALLILLVPVSAALLSCAGTGSAVSLCS